MPTIKTVAMENNCCESLDSANQLLCEREITTILGAPILHQQHLFLWNLLNSDRNHKTKITISTFHN